MGLNLGNKQVMNAYFGGGPVSRIMFNGEEVWPLDLIGGMAGKIVFAHRYTTIQTYERAFLDKATEAGFEVLAEIPHTDIFTLDYVALEADWLVIGSPGTGHSGVPNAAGLMDLPVNILTMCSHTGMNAFNMASSVRSYSTSNYIIRRVDHSAPLPNYTVGQTVQLGTSVSTRSLYNVKSGNTVLAHRNGSSSYTGVIIKDGTEFRRVYWSYYRFDTISPDGMELFRQVMQLEYPLVAAGDVRIRWMGELPKFYPVDPDITKAPDILLVNYSQAIPPFVVAPYIKYVRFSWKDPNEDS